MKPIFTKKNIRILAFIVILAGFVISGMAWTLWRLINGENVSDEVRVSTGTGLLIVGPWIFKFANVFGG